MNPKTMMTNNANNSRKRVLLGLPKGAGGNPQDNLWAIRLESRSQARRLAKGYSSAEPGVVIIGVEEDEERVLIRVAWRDEAIERGIEFQPITESLLTRLMGYAA